MLHYMYGVLLLLLTDVIQISLQHGMLVWPPQRGSLWRHGYGTLENDNDGALYCGGIEELKRAEGKCGVCGDPFYGPRDHEAGGKYANGIIVGKLDAGVMELNVTVKVTGHDKGYFEFRICPHNNPEVPVQQSCLDKHLLEIEGGDSSSNYTRYYQRETTDLNGEYMYTLTLRMPFGISCSQCVLQWRYVTGNTWGEGKNGTSCQGCGLQEEVRNCADISIGDTRSNDMNNPISPGIHQDIQEYNSTSNNQEILDNNSTVNNQEIQNYNVTVDNQIYNSTVNTQDIQDYNVTVDNQDYNSTANNQDIQKYNVTIDNQDYSSTVNNQDIQDYNVTVDNQDYNSTANNQDIQKYNVTIDNQDYSSTVNNQDIQDYNVTVDNQDYNSTVNNQDIQDNNSTVNNQNIKEYDSTVSNASKQDTSSIVDNPETQENKRITSNPTLQGHSAVVNSLSIQDHDSIAIKLGIQNHKGTGKKSDIQHHNDIVNKPDIQGINMEIQDHNSVLSNSQIQDQYSLANSPKIQDHIAVVNNLNIQDHGSIVYNSDILQDYNSKVNNPDIKDHNNTVQNPVIHNHGNTVNDPDLQDLDGVSNNPNKPEHENIEKDQKTKGNNTENHIMSNIRSHSEIQDHKGRVTDQEIQGKNSVGNNSNTQDNSTVVNNSGVQDHGDILNNGDNMDQKGLVNITPKKENYSTKNERDRQEQINIANTTAIQENRNLKNTSGTHIYNSSADTETAQDYNNTENELNRRGEYSTSIHDNNDTGNGLDLLGEYSRAIENYNITGNDLDILGDYNTGNNAITLDYNNIESNPGRKDGNIAGNNPAIQDNSNTTESTGTQYNRSIIRNEQERNGSITVDNSDNQDYNNSTTETMRADNNTADNKEVPYNNNISNIPMVHGINPGQGHNSFANDPVLQDYNSTTNSPVGQDQTQSNLGKQTIEFGLTTNNYNEAGNGSKSSEISPVNKPNKGDHGSLGNAGTNIKIDKTVETKGEDMIAIESNNAVEKNNIGVVDSPETWQQNVIENILDTKDKGLHMIGNDSIDKYKGNILHVKTGKTFDENRGTQENIGIDKYENMQTDQNQSVNDQNNQDQPNVMNNTDSYDPINSKYQPGMNDLNNMEKRTDHPENGISDQGNKSVNNMVDSLDNQGQRNIVVNQGGVDQHGIDVNRGFQDENKMIKNQGIQEENNTSLNQTNEDQNTMTVNEGDQGKNNRDENRGNQSQNNRTVSEGDYDQNNRAVNKGDHGQNKMAINQGDQDTTMVTVNEGDQGQHNRSVKHDTHDQNNMTLDQDPQSRHNITVNQNSQDLGINYGKKESSGHLNDELPIPNPQHNIQKNSITGGSVAGGSIMNNQDNNSLSSDVNVSLDVQNGYHTTINTDRIEENWYGPNDKEIRTGNGTEGTDGVTNSNVTGSDNPSINAEVDNVDKIDKSYNGIQNDLIETKQLENRVANSVKDQKMTNINSISGTSAFRNSPRTVHLKQDASDSINLTELSPLSDVGNNKTFIPITDLIETENVTSKTQFGGGEGINSQESSGIPTGNAKTQNRLKEILVPQTPQASIEYSDANVSVNFIEENITSLSSSSLTDKSHDLDIGSNQAGNHNSSTAFLGKKGSGKLEKMQINSSDEISTTGIGLSNNFDRQNSVPTEGVRLPLSIGGFKLGTIDGTTPITKLFRDVPNNDSNNPYSSSGNDGKIVTPEYVIYGIGQEKELLAQIGQKLILAEKQSKRKEVDNTINERQRNLTYSSQSAKNGSDIGQIKQSSPVIPDLYQGENDDSLSDKDPNLDVKANGETAVNISDTLNNNTGIVRDKSINAVHGKDSGNSKTNGFNSSGNETNSDLKNKNSQLQRKAENKVITDIPGSLSSTIVNGEMNVSENFVKNTKAVPEVEIDALSRPPKTETTSFPTLQNGLKRDMPLTNNGEWKGEEKGLEIQSDSLSVKYKDNTNYSNTEDQNFNIPSTIETKDNELGRMPQHQFESYTHNNETITKSTSDTTESMYIFPAPTPPIYFGQTTTNPMTLITIDYNDTSPSDSIGTSNIKEKTAKRNILATTLIPYVYRETAGHDGDGSTGNMGDTVIVTDESDIQQIYQTENTKTGHRNSQQPMSKDPELLNITENQTSFYDQVNNKNEGSIPIEQSVAKHNEFSGKVNEGTSKDRNLNTVEEVNRDQTTEYPVEEFNRDQTTTYPVGEVNRDQTTTYPVEEVNRDQATTYPVEEVYLDQTTTYPVGEVNRDQTTTYPVEEVNRDQTTTYPVGEVNRDQTTTYPVGEVNRDQTTTYPVEEVNWDQTTTYPVGEVNRDQTTTNPVGEINRDQTTTYPVEEVNRDQTTTYLVGEVNRDQTTTNPVEEVNRDQSTEYPVEEFNRDQTTTYPVGEVNRDQTTTYPVEEVNRDQTTTYPVDQVYRDQTTAYSVEEINRDQTTTYPVEEVNRDQTTTNSVEEVNRDQTTAYPVEEVNRDQTTAYPIEEVNRDQTTYLVEEVNRDQTTEYPVEEFNRDQTTAYLVGEVNRDRTYPVGEANWDQTTTYPVEEVNRDQTTTFSVDVIPDGPPIPDNSQVYASTLEPGKTLTYTFPTLADRSNKRNYNKPPTSIRSNPAGDSMTSRMKENRPLVAVSSTAGNNEELSGASVTTYDQIVPSVVSRVLTLDESGKKQAKSNVESDHYDSPVKNTSPNPPNNYTIYKPVVSSLPLDDNNGPVISSLPTDGKLKAEPVVITESSSQSKLSESVVSSIQTNGSDRNEGNIHTVTDTGHNRYDVVTSTPTFDHSNNVIVLSSSSVMSLNDNNTKHDLAARTLQTDGYNQSDSALVKVTSNAQNMSETTGGIMKTYENKDYENAVSTIHINEENEYKPVVGTMSHVDNKLDQDVDTISAKDNYKSDTIVNTMSTNNDKNIEAVVSTTNDNNLYDAVDKSRLANKNNKTESSHSVILTNDLSDNVVSATPNDYEKKYETDVITRPSGFGGKYETHVGGMETYDKSQDENGVGSLEINGNNQRELSVNIMQNDNNYKSDAKTPSSDINNNETDVTTMHTNNKSEYETTASSAPINDSNDYETKVSSLPIADNNVNKGAGDTMESKGNNEYESIVGTLSTYNENNNISSNAIVAPTKGMSISESAMPTYRSINGLVHTTMSTNYSNSSDSAVITKATKAHKSNKPVAEKMPTTETEAVTTGVSTGSTPNQSINDNTIYRPNTDSAQSHKKEHVSDVSKSNTIDIKNEAQVGERSINGLNNEASTTTGSHSTSVTGEIHTKEKNEHNSITKGIPIYIDTDIEGPITLSGKNSLESLVDVESTNANDGYQPVVRAMPTANYNTLKVDSMSANNDLHDVSSDYNNQGAGFRMKSRGVGARIETTSVNNDVSRTEDLGTIDSRLNIADNMLQSTPVPKSANAGIYTDYSQSYDTQSKYSTDFEKIQENPKAKQKIQSGGNTKVIQKENADDLMKKYEKALTILQVLRTSPDRIFSKMKIKGFKVSTNAILKYAGQIALSQLKVKMGSDLDAYFSGQGLKFRTK